MPPDKLCSLKQHLENKYYLGERELDRLAQFKLNGTTWAFKIFHAKNNW